MDNPLTPGKIQRLMKYAEDKSFNLPRRLLLNEVTVDASSSPQPSSLGILDLDQIEALGESGIGNMSLSKSTTFNPGEMTGRSTGAEDVTNHSMPLKIDEYGRHSLMALDNLQSQMDKQTSEINDIMRHSIASNYSFHSKRDLTADEASFVMREAPIPVQHSTQAFQDSMMSINASSMSVGAYFKNRCPEFGRILSKTDSPDRSAMQPSITEVSTTTDQMENIFKIDSTLDSVPVKESLHSITNKTFNKQPDTNHNPKELHDNMSEYRDNTNMTTFTPIPNKQIPLAKQDVHFAVPKPYGSTLKATDILIKNLQSSLRPITDDTEGSVDNSLSISKIADYLGKQSNVSVTEMLYLNQKKQAHKKVPLTEKQMNIPEKCKIEQNIQVMQLKDTKNIDAASSSGSVNTVVPIKLKLEEQENRDVSIAVTKLTKEALPSNIEGKLSSKTRSKSPSSKSQSTLSTVHENFASFKSGPDSPLHTTGDANTTKYIPSPNVEYKELDKSVDWREVLRQKQHNMDGLAKEQWADITAPPVKGFVGVPCPITLKVATLTDSWLTAKFQFIDLPNEGRDLTIELPRLPLLLAPGKSETLSIHVTSNSEMDSVLRYSMSLKDAALDNDVEQMGEIVVQMKLPTIQAMSSEGINILNFPATQEKTSITRSLIFISDCPADLQILLSVTEGYNMFSIRNVQEVKKDDINKVLMMDRQGSSEDHQKVRSKAMNKQLCRLSRGNATKVSICFTAPNLSELNLNDSAATLKGALQVNLMGIDTVLRKVDLIGAVGVAKLIPENYGGKLEVGSEPAILKLKNAGSVPGSWIVKFRALAGTERNVPFKISPCKFDVSPGCGVDVAVTHVGSDSCEMTIYFEEVTTGQKTVIELSSVSEPPKRFPIKTNVPSLCWVRPGRREISLKNCADKKVHIRCQIKGEGFSLDLPGVESRGVYSLSFLPNECRVLSVIFQPNSVAPQAGSMHLVFDKNTECSRKILLHGCAGGESPRWSGLATYGDTALVRAVSRSPIELRLHNRANTPAFVCATVHYNLQYQSIAPYCRLLGGKNVIPPRSFHTISLLLEWSRVERRAREVAVTALATLTVLTGSEFTRSRLLRVLKNDTTGELDTSLLPQHLKQLTDTFEGQDKNTSVYLKDFNEPKSSLNELINGIHELNAQIDLPQDFSDENTIIISDDTVVEHHTLCD